MIYAYLTIITLLSLNNSI